MEYCSRCGCYMPDGYADCPACGHTAGSAAVALKKPADIREEKKKEYRAWADEEIRKRKETENAPASETLPEESTSGKEKLIAALSYISVLCFIPYIIKGSKFTLFHADQGKRLLCAAIIGDILGYFFSSFWAIQLIRLLLVLCGIKNVIKGREEPLPVIGKDIGKE